MREIEKEIGMWKERYIYYLNLKAHKNSQRQISQYFSEEEISVLQKLDKINFRGKH